MNVLLVKPGFVACAVPALGLPERSASGRVDSEIVFNGDLGTSNFRNTAFIEERGLTAAVKFESYGSGYRLQQLRFTNHC